MSIILFEVLNTMRFSLKEYNTFGINVLCHKVVRIKSLDRLIETIQKDASEKLIIGGGSNILFTKNIEETVLVNQLIGKKIIKQTDEHVWVSFASGELWHDCVEWAIENDFGGMENLSLIPGTMGAAPIQNIGAYGVELSEIFDSLEAYDLIWGDKKIFTKEECQFGYRDSIFKNELKNQYFITTVTLKLTVEEHILKTDYADVKKYLKENEIDDPDIADISEAICEIREEKLPDVEEFPNAGSFFKNPIISKVHFDRLKEKFPKIKFYPEENPNRIKIPAAWLIEQAGWKGKRIEDVGTHKNQALVIVNFGNATGGEVLAFARKIQKSVKDMFSIELEMEVNVL
jgi:UDP-N-acetylmuramate dehydrogenase